MISNEFKILKMSKREADAVEALFKRYDTERKGEITKAQLKACLCDISGKKISDNEVFLIFNFS